MTRSRETGDVGYRAYKKNLIQNAQFNIWQRGTPISVGGSDLYTADRWGALAAGANISVDKVVQDGSSYLFVNGAVGNTLSEVFQRIEGVNMSYASNAGTDLTASVNLYHSESATVTWIAFAANALDDFAAKTVIATGTFDTVASYVTYEFSFSLAGFTAHNGVEIRFEFGALPAGALVAIRFMQLEQGTSATPLEYVSADQDLAACQRYYEIGAGNFFAYADNSNTPFWTAGFKVKKRSATPVTFTFTNGGRNNLAGPTVDFGSDDDGVTFTDGNIIATGAANTVVSWTADAEL